jgi:uncharacterized protein
MTLPAETIGASAAIILFAYFVRGISGFGSGLIAVPLLAHFAPLTFVVPLILVTDFTASAVLGRAVRGHIQWREIRALLPASALGVILGVTLLLKLPRESLLTALGVFVLIFGVRNVLNLHGAKPVSRRWAWPAGLVGGTVGAMFGTGGPPYVIYLTHRLRDKSQLRATFSGLFMLDGGIRVVTFLVTGLLLQPDLLWAVPGALPLLGLGLYLGHRAHVGLSPKQILRVIGTILLVSGTSLLWKAWG